MEPSELQFADPSVQAAIYQAEELAGLLASFTDEKHLPNALRLRDILKAVALALGSQLEGLAEVHRRRELLKDHPGHLERLRALVNAITGLYTATRYVDTCSSSSVPPSLDRFVSGVVCGLRSRCLRGQEFDYVVRPKWNYNLSYVDFHISMEEILVFLPEYAATVAAMQQPSETVAPKASGIVDRSQMRDAVRDLSRHDRRQVVKGVLNTLVSSAKSLPGFIGILSYAGLDREDTLLFPLLAHEIGHLIDDLTGVSETNLTPEFAFANPRLQACAREVSESGRLPRGQHSALEFVAKQAMSVVREIAADLLALHTLGPSYFFAFFEYMKTTYLCSPSATQACSDRAKVLLNEGYPGQLFRMKLLVEEIQATDLRRPLEAIAGLPEGSNHKQFRSYWDRIVQHFSISDRDLYSDFSGNPTRATSCSTFDELIQSHVPKLQDAVRALNWGGKIRRDLVENMIQRLILRLPMFDEQLSTSSGPSDILGDIREILLAAWVYQIEAGDHAESVLGSNQERSKFYRTTCELVGAALLGAERLKTLRRPA